MAEVGTVDYVGSVLGRTCNCILVGGEFFPLMGRSVWQAGFVVSVGILPAADWVCVLVLLAIWVRHPALGVAGSWVVIILDTEKAMAPHSSTFAWKIQWMEEPGRL